MAKKTLEQRHESFLNYYKKFESNIERINEEEGTDFKPYSAPYTKEEYSFFYKALAQARKEEGKPLGNINRDLARDLMYNPKMSQATAVATSKYAKEYGIVDPDTGEVTYPNIYKKKDIQKIRLQGVEGEVAKRLFTSANEMYWSEIEKMTGSVEAYKNMSKEERKKIVLKAKREVSKFYWGSPD